MGGRGLDIIFILFFSGEKISMRNDEGKQEPQRCAGGVQGVLMGVGCCTKCCSSPCFLSYSAFPSRTSFFISGGRRSLLFLIGFDFLYIYVMSASVSYLVPVRP